jgi:hypothetical protein
MSLPSAIDRISAKYRCERSASGHAPDELKSGLQKYCRRGEEAKALRCASELYCFRLVDGGKAVYTNLLHRLMIVYLEDVGPANYDVWKLLDLLLVRLREPDGPDARQALCWWVSVLCECEHSRALSHVAAVYRDGSTRCPELLRDAEGLEHVMDEAGVDAYERTHARMSGLRAELRHGYPRFRDGRYDAKSARVVDADGEDVREEVGNMLALLYARSDGAFYWMYRVLRHEKVGKHPRSTKPGFLLLDALRWFGLERLRHQDIRHEHERLYALLDCAERWYAELGALKEAALCVAMCVQWLLSALRPVAGAEAEVWIDADGQAGVFTHVGEPLQLDEYVLDMHTRAGRRAGKGRAVFAAEGALVVRECARVTRPEYKRFYELLKQRQDDVLAVPARRAAVSCAEPADGAQSTEIIAIGDPAAAPSESEYLRFEVRAQATCSDYRPDTYLATERATGRHVFVKGPYRSAEEASVPARLCRVKRLCMPELPATSVELKLLVPDLFPDVPLGTRRHVDRARPQWFLVTDSLVPADAPRTMHSTPVWGRVEVVDWAALALRDGGRGVPAVLSLSGARMRGYVLALLFKWALGVPDVADRNFLLVADVVYSCDEEGFGRDVSYVASLKRRKCDYIKAYVRSRWAELGPVLASWLERVRTNAARVRVTLAVRDVDWLVRRLERLQSAEGVASTL